MIATGGDSEAVIAVGVCGGLGGGRRSRRAVRWAADHLVPYACRVVLVHVIPAITSIPSPSGQLVPVDLLGRDVVEMYVQDQKLKAQRVFFEFRRLCGTRNIDTIVLEGKDPASALLKYVSESGIRNLVLGSSSNWLRRILKGPDVPMTTLKYSSNFCNIFVVSRTKLIVKFTDRLVSDDPTYSSHIGTISHKLLGQGGAVSHSYTWSDRMSFVSTYSETTQFSAVHEGEQNNRILSVPSRKKYGCLASIKHIHLAVFRTTNKNEPLAGVSKLKKELQATIAKYHQVCNDLVDAKTKVHLLSTECSEAEKKIKNASEREEALKSIAAEKKANHLEAVKEVEEVKQFSSHMQEALERQKAELAGKVSFEKSEIMDAYFLNSNRCRRYSKDEIEYATDNFSEAKKIGEGSCGSVYKCTLDHIPVAVKVLLQNAQDKKEQFLREVEILSQLHHPHMLLLLGVCLENACLVYEYMENGSLEDQLFDHGKKPLPCIIRFQILYEAACGLAFLHGNKPEPIVHRDLKPGNILLDRNYVSKIGDVGLAKLLYDVVPDGLTEYKETILAGTFFYMDPEYQRTGTIRPKSDIYAWGVIALQLLTGKHPNGLIVSVENAIKQGTFSNVLDPSITDWDPTEAERLAKLALQCTRLRCRDRPDLSLEILPELEDILNKGNTYSNLKRNSIDVPKHFFCPILQEVMVDPYVAADGYTYEYRAIKEWLEKYDTSPVTKLKLSHRSIIPNLSLRSAMQEWK